MSLDNIKTVNDLPIYDDESTALSRQIAHVCIPNQRNALEEVITSLRQSTFQFLNKYKEEKEKSITFVETTKADLNQKLDYLRSESVILPKIVFISLSGFGGLLLGFRKSNFRKIVYSGCLTAASTALCFPNQAKSYTNEATQFTKQKVELIYKTYIWSEAAKQSTAPKSDKKPSDTIKGKDQIIKLEIDSSNQETRQLAGDKGQANSDDQDMYTTRGAK